MTEAHAEPRPADAEHKRLHLQRVLQAGERLGGIGLTTRDVAQFYRWLVFKRAGGGGGTSAEVTTEVCRAFIDAFFGVPGRGDYRWFDPFVQQWRVGTKGRHWGVQTVWTQIDRLPSDPSGLFTENTRLAPGRRRLTAASSPDYEERLEAIFGDKRVPLSELAVWRYRFDQLPMSATLDDLKAELEKDLHFTQGEIERVFAVEASDEP